MRKIINKILYNTSTVLFIGRASNRTVLYRNPGSGQYSLSGGGNIALLTPAGAYKWAKTYLDPEIVKQEFGDQVSEA